MRALIVAFALHVFGQFAEAIQSKRDDQCIVKLLLIASLLPEGSRFGWVWKRSTAELHHSCTFHTHPHWHMLWLILCFSCAFPLFLFLSPLAWRVFRDATQALSFPLSSPFFLLSRQFSIFFRACFTVHSCTHSLSSPLCFSKRHFVFRGGTIISPPFVFLFSAVWSVFVVFSLSHNDSVVLCLAQCVVIAVMLFPTLFPFFLSHTHFQFLHSLCLFFILCCFSLSLRHWCAIFETMQGHFWTVQLDRTAGLPPPIVMEKHNAISDTDDTIQHRAGFWTTPLVTPYAVVPNLHLGDIGEFRLSMRLIVLWGPFDCINSAWA